MSEGMFMGRKFTIPYDTSTDKQVASMMRAQTITRTATPGTVIQVGDTVMAYGVTPEQAKMGNLDVSMRSFEQLSNQAQEAVRRNIQWQYGEQVADSSQPVTEPMKKSWWRRLIGAVKTVSPDAKLYDRGTGRVQRDLPEPSLFAAPQPAKTAPGPVPTKEAEPVASTPAKRIRAAKKTVQQAAPVIQTAPEPVSEAAPAAVAKPKKTSKPKAKAAALSTPAKASSKPKATAAPRTQAAEQKAVVSGGPSMDATTDMEFHSAFKALARRHKAARDGWTVTREFPDENTAVSVARDASGAEERHTFQYHPETSRISHTFTPAGGAEPIQTHFSNHAELHTHVRADHKPWAF